MKRKFYGAVAMLAFLGMGVAELSAKESGTPGGGVLPAALCLVVFIFASHKAGAFYKQ